MSSGHTLGYGTYYVQWPYFGVRDMSCLVAILCGTAHIISSGHTLGYRTYYVQWPYLGVRDILCSGLSYIRGHRQTYLGVRDILHLVAILWGTGLFMSSGHTLGYGTYYVQWPYFGVWDILFLQYPYFGVLCLTYGHLPTCLDFFLYSTVSIHTPPC